MKKLAILLIMLATPVFAIQPDEILENREFETRAREISKGLRCLVCQNQSIDDSDAPLARDLRVLGRDRIEMGETDDQVMKYIVDRYGDFVLLSPPLKLSTVVLWSAPTIFLSIGVFGLFRWFRRRPQENWENQTPLTVEENKKLADALNSKIF